MPQRFPGRLGKRISTRQRNKRPASQALQENSPSLFSLTLSSVSFQVRAIGGSSFHAFQCQLVTNAICPNREPDSEASLPGTLWEKDCALTQNTKIERSLVMRKFPAPNARLREAPSVQLPAPSQARPPSFLRVFFAATLAWLCLSRTLFGAITCNVKHEQSTSELCRKRQRSRVSERNPDGCLTPTPPCSAKTEEM